MIVWDDIKGTGSTLTASEYNNMVTDQKSRALDSDLTIHTGSGTIHFTESSIDHTAITNIGTNPHTSIDSHIGAGSIHYVESSIDHTNITNIGTNPHASIDSHIGAGSIHYTESTIDHTNITNIGTNPHSSLDSHVGAGSIHFTEASIDHTTITNIGTNTHNQLDAHISSTGSDHTWLNQDVTTTGSVVFSDIGTTGSVTAGFFYGDGSNLTNVTGTGSVNDLLDATITAVGSGEYFSYDGSQWINTSLPSGSGEANAGSNIGSGIGIYDGKSGINLDFKTLTAGSNITVTDVGNSVEITSTGGASPLTTKGDLYGFSTVDARLPVGTNDYVLVADSTQSLGVKWAANSAGFSDPMTTRGDIIIRDATNTTNRLAIGTASQVLTSDGTDISWSAAGGGGASFVWKEKFNGSVSTGLLAYFVVPDELDGKSIKEIRVSVLGLPTGSALKVDCRLNGTATTDSVLTSDVEIEIATSATATNGVYMSACDSSGTRVGSPATTLDSARTTLASDDVIYYYVTAIGSTISGADLVTQISIE